ncbi:MAG: diguanylate cyclase [Solirubrobacterales bacterium]
MSFGRRLILFFLLIVMLPMLAVGGLLLQVTSESRTGKADAQLAAGLDTALALADEQTAVAQQLASRFASDPGLAHALRGVRAPALRSVAAGLAAKPEVVAVILEGPTAGQLARAGDPSAIEFARVELHEPGTQQLLGTLAVSTSTATGFVQRLARLTGREAVVVRDGRKLAGTLEISADQVPAPGDTNDISIGGDDQRARSVELTDGDQLVLFGPTEVGGSTINTGVALLLALLLAAAVAFAFFLARTLHTLYELTSQQAVTDELTGLSNQRRFRELLTKETERARRFGHDLALLMLDFDDFKKVNDTHGHLQGDDVLRVVSGVMREEVREVDEPARYGGEELAVALPETAPQGAAEVAERIRTRIEDSEIPMRSGTGSVGVTVSIGVAGLDGKVTDVDGLIAAADKALYEAKHAGKNQVRKASVGKRATGRRKGDRRKSR